MRSAAGVSNIAVPTCANVRVWVAVQANSATDTTTTPRAQGRAWADTPAEERSVWD